MSILESIGKLFRSNPQSQQLSQFKDGDRFTLDSFRVNGRWYVNNDAVGITDENVKHGWDDGNILPKNAHFSGLV